MPTKFLHITTLRKPLLLLSNSKVSEGRFMTSESCSTFCVEHPTNFPGSSSACVGLSRTPLGSPRTPLGSPRIRLGSPSACVGSSRIPLGLSRTRLGSSRISSGSPSASLGSPSIFENNLYSIIEGNIPLPKLIIKSKIIYN